ncbi:FAD-dependent protein [Mycena kentingensis (nom. inval.)]|nr:FAD-dependent protein [Mycena kentingensis (nom. inval.)]
MGSLLSRARFALSSASDALSELEQVEKRINTSPGLPVPNPPSSYWALPPSIIANWGAAAPLPGSADVVIIGSGITGMAVARTLLALAPTTRVVMLEAREACSGATGRNGGHLTPDLFHDYEEMRNAYGAQVAQEIVRFRLADLPTLLEVCTEEGILEDSQCRSVETYDVHFDRAEFESAKASLAVYLEDMPEQRPKWSFVENAEVSTLHLARCRLLIVSQELQLSPERIVGIIATRAGAIHSYRFVTGVLSRLLERHPDNFQLLTNTPCISISSDAENYTLTTPKGAIRAKHVVHATNAWASHLLPTLRGKIIPIREHMSAQRPGMGLGNSFSTITLPDSWFSKRTFVFYGENAAAYNYLSQQPVSSSPSKTYPSPCGEFMFGGGLHSGNLLCEIGVADDRAPNSIGVSAYLGGLLAVYFGSAWGEEGRSLDANTPSGRMLKVWTGIIGFSADRKPWVGRLPEKLTRRRCPKSSALGFAPPAEWIAAGYSGEGMSYAYLSGKAIAEMLVQNATEVVLPEPFVVGEKRWKKARLRDFDSILSA